MLIKRCNLKFCQITINWETKKCIYDNPWPISSWTCFGVLQKYIRIRDIILVVHNIQCKLLLMQGVTKVHPIIHTKTLSQIHTREFCLYLKCIGWWCWKANIWWSRAIKITYIQSVQKYLMQAEIWCPITSYIMQ